MSGNNGSISLTGANVAVSIAVSDNINTAFSGLSPSFATTRFANSALVAGNISFVNASDDQYHRRHPIFRWYGNIFN